MESVEFREDIDKFLSDTQEARWASERDRDYYDHKQWTDDEVKKLKARNQAPIVVNRIKPKVEGLIGLYNLRNTDPKAYARTKKHEKASHAITDALRYVSDNNKFDSVKLECAEDFWVEGTCGAIVKAKQAKDGIEIEIDRIPWDRIYFDPHSRRKDFKDASFKGCMLWLDVDKGKTMFPKVDVEALVKDSPDVTDETFEDRPRWAESKRFRVAYHYYLKDGKWWFCIFSGNTFLLKPQESPYLDDDGEPCCPIELVSANVDRNNQRYGEVRGYISQQDEINHRRSKALHLLSQRQTYARKGEVGDVAKIKRELSKPDGHVEFNGNEFGKDFGILPTGDMANGQIQLYLDAKGELDAVGFNAQLAGERQSGDLSGKAIDKLQRAGTVELNRQYQLLNNWENRIYRQIWARIKQFWDEEKWIRVTDDYDNLRWVGLNGQVTAREWMEERINDESLSLLERRKLAASYTFLTQAEASNDMETAEAAQKQLDAVISVKNEVAQIDVDIIIEQSFDVINVQQEQFQALAQFAQGSDIDIIELIELSQIRGKDELIEKIEKRRAQQAVMAGNVAQKQAQTLDVKNALTYAQAQKTTQEAQQKAIETQLMIERPMDTQVIV